ncbi:WW domain-containing protein [Colletotrichum higginsianum]|nr:WW domain-containing protein [Colletotrichum higginsianum]
MASDSPRPDSSPQKADFEQSRPADIAAEGEQSTKQDSTTPEGAGGNDFKRDSSSPESGEASSTASPAPSDAGDEKTASSSDAPPLPDEVPPLPSGPPPATQDDGWDFHGKTPVFPLPPPPLRPAPPRGNTAEENEANQASSAAYAAEYGATAQFNRFTGQFQTLGEGPDRHSDEAKSKRQMNAFFDVDAAANSHDGRSLKAERSGKKPSKAELKQFKEKRRARKEEKRRAWLRD